MKYFVEKYSITGRRWFYRGTKWYGKEINWTRKLSEARPLTKLKAESLVERNDTRPINVVAFTDVELFRAILKGC